MALCRALLQILRMSVPCIHSTQRSPQPTAGQSKQKKITIWVTRTKGPYHTLVLPLCRKPYEKEVHCKMFLCQSRGSWDKQGQILSGAYLWRDTYVAFNWVAPHKSSQHYFLALSEIGPYNITSEDKVNSVWVQKLASILLNAPQFNTQLIRVGWEFRT